MNSTLFVFIGFAIPFLATVIGSIIIFFIKKDISQKSNSIINGFSSGIMISASIFGLILPSFSQATNLGKWYFLPSIIGTILGSLLLLFADLITNKTIKKESNVSSVFHNKKLSHIWLAFAIHNIPEGLALGFAFGRALNIGTAEALLTTLSLSIGIAIQNFPEGLIVALPIYNETKNRKKGFFYSLLSAIIEPIFACVGIVLATSIQSLMPWLLCFAAGTIIFVTIDDLIPESKNESSPHIGSYSFIVGFILMMLLDLLF